jgi:phosphoglycolate phosphatase
MKRPIDTILFDFDYTLADSSFGVGKCINLALEALDFPAVDYSTACNTIGLSLKDTFVSLVGRHHHAHADAFARLFVSYADMIMAEHTVLLPSVPQMVQRLHKDAYQMGIVSNNRRYRIEAVLQNERISSQFQVIVGEEDVSQHKPEPEGLLAAIERLNGTQARTIYVGDSTIDAETARRANVPFVAVLSGITTREAFDRYDSYAVVDNLGELPHVLSSYHRSASGAGGRERPLGGIMAHDLRQAMHWQQAGCRVSDARSAVEVCARQRLPGGKELLGRALEYYSATLVAALGAHVDDPIGVLDNRQVVLDDNHRISGVHQPIDDD